MKPLFSIVVIGKNEADNLPRLLKSLENFKAQGGEMIFLDTGSTDATVKIVTEFGFKVTEVGSMFVLKMEDQKLVDEINAKYVVEGEEPIIKVGDSFFDYGAARNYVAQLASNDFVIGPDCDEELTVLNIEKLNELIAEGWQRFTFDYVYSHDEAGRPAMQFVCDRGAFDRRFFSWKGHVHEVLTGEGKAMYVDRSLLYIEQFPGPATQRTTSHNDLVGLSYECFHDQENDRNLHYFARELMFKNRFKSSIRQFRKHMDLKKWDLERGQSITFIGDCHWWMGDLEEAVYWYNESFRYCSARREPLIKLAEIYQKRQDYQRTAAFAAAALTIPYVQYYANNMAHYRDYPHFLLYWALYWLGDKEGAKLHWEKALNYSPMNPRYIEDAKFFGGLPGAPGTPTAIEGWMAPDELACLEGLAKLSTSVVEVGSWKGRSTRALLSNCPGDVYAVDTWGGCPEDPATIEEAKSKDILAEFMKNVGNFPNLKVKKMTSLEAAAEIESVDMIFLDGSHQYEDVVADIKAWLPKAKKIICGHDYTYYPGVKKAVDELIGKVELCNSIWIKTI